MNNSQVAHAWAGQQKERASGSHFFFDGPSIYSYGRHFEIARHVTGADGSRAILYTTRDYSPTTAKHKCYVWRAILNADVFTVPRVDVGAYASGNADAHGANLAHFLETAKTAHEKARRALANGKLYGETEARAVRDAAAYLEFFGRRAMPKTSAAVIKELRALERRRVAGKLWTAAELAEFDAREERAKETKKRRDEARAAKWARQSAEWQRRAEERLAESHAEEIERPERIAAAREILDKWAAGASNELPEFKYCEELPTRVRVNGANIETSRGARVSVARAVELWRLMAADDGPNAAVLGFDVDGFRVSAWDGETVTIGCHELKREELARVAALLGV